MKVKTALIDCDGNVPFVAIEVEDNGCGIPADVVPKVFDPFFTTKDPDKGTGLGLSICKTIVEQFGGSLAIESVRGSGTTVTATIPASGP